VDAGVGPIAEDTAGKLTPANSYLDFMEEAIGWMTAEGRCL